MRVAAPVWQDWRGRSSHDIPLLCPPRHAGQWAECQRSQLGNGYLRATGKVSHLRITHTVRGAARRRGTVAVLSCSSDHEEEGQRRGFRAQEKENDTSLVRRYALVNSILLSDSLACVTTTRLQACPSNPLLQCAQGSAKTVAKH